MSDGGSTEHIAHFTVCGKGITNIVRNMYCFDENKVGAIAILSHFDGMTQDQMIKVVTGDAHLKDMNDDGTMGYVEISDMEFKRKYHGFLMENARYVLRLKEAEEQRDKEIAEAAKKNHIDVEDQKFLNEMNPYHESNLVRDRLSLRGQQIYKSGIAIKLSDKTTIQQDSNDDRTPHADALINKLIEQKKRKPAPPSKETITVGKWEVPKNYLDRYANHVVKRIRGLIRMQCAGICSIAAFDPIGTYELEMERQDLHNAICDAIGVSHSKLGKERTQDQIDFDEALDKYLDKHSGSLFNGDGD